MTLPPLPFDKEAFVPLLRLPDGKISTPDNERIDVQKVELDKLEVRIEPNRPR